MSAPAMDRLAYTIDSAAAALDLSAPTVRRLIKAGTLPAKRLGRGYRIKASDLQAYLDALPDA